MFRCALPAVLCLALLGACSDSTSPTTDDEDVGVFPVIETGQELAYDADGAVIDPAPGEALYGQDAHRAGTPAELSDNGDGTVSDAATGLQWSAAPLFAEGRTRADCLDAVEVLDLGGHEDWRLPSVKELLSLLRYGADPVLLDTGFLSLVQPDTAWGLGDRPAVYVSRDRRVDALGGTLPEFYGVDFLEGRVRAHPLGDGGDDDPLYWVRAVRSQENPLYGWNNFVDNEDGTVTDLSTGLMWQRVVERRTMDWPEALAYAEALELADHDDWALPDVKELHSLVDYSLPAPCLDDLFTVPTIDAWFWSSTSAPDDPSQAFYVAFGPATDYRGNDTHGAGAVRSDPKTGLPSAWTTGQGAERDAVRIQNFVRCVRKTE